MNHTFSAMKIALLCVLAIALPVHGEQSRGNASGDHGQVQSIEPTPSLIAVKQEHPCNQNNPAAKQAQSYFHELISANNLPNLLLFIAGLGGIGVGVYTLRDIRKQTRLLRDYVVATKQMAIAALRPKLEVKHVFLIPDKDITERPEDGDHWRIGCVIANVGGSKAQITGSDLTIRKLGIGTLEGLLPNIPPYQGKYTFGDFHVVPGERQERFVVLGLNEETLDLRTSHHIAAFRERAGKPHVKTSPIVCFGFLRYQDESGVSRLTGFGCLWNSEDMSFTRLDHANYEYAD